MRYYTVGISNIQTTSNFDNNEVEELAKAIVKSGGLIKPLVLKQIGLHTYEIVEGHFEFHAAKRAKEISPKTCEMVNAMVIQDKKVYQSGEAVIDTPDIQQAIAEQLEIINKNISNKTISGEKINGVDTTPVATDKSVKPQNTQPKTETKAEAPEYKSKVQSILPTNNDGSVETSCRLSDSTPHQYRGVIKDKVLQIRDRNKLKTKPKNVNNIIEKNPYYLQKTGLEHTLKTLKELDILHSIDNTELMIAALKKQFKTFKKAKLATKIKAVSWQKLAEKLVA